MNHTNEKVDPLKKQKPTTNSSQSQDNQKPVKEKLKSNNSNCNNDVKDKNTGKSYRAAFNAVDSNFDGRITMKELKEAFAKLGNNVSDEDVATMIQEADLDNNGSVEFNEFIELMKKFRMAKGKQTKSSDTEAYEVFKAFDHNGDDMLDFNEIKNTMIALGEHVTDEDVRAMISEADLDRNGKIDFTEFKRIMEMYQRKASI